MKISGWFRAPAQRGLYKNTFDCLFKIVRNEGPLLCSSHTLCIRAYAHLLPSPSRSEIILSGPLALFNGLESTIWRNGVWNGIYFGSIFKIREMLPKAKVGDRRIAWATAVAAYLTYNIPTLYEYVN